MMLEIEKIQKLSDGVTVANLSVEYDANVIDNVFNNHPEVDVIYTKKDESFYDEHFFAYRPVWFSGEYTRNIRRRKSDICFTGQDEKNHHYVYADDE